MDPIDAEQIPVPEVKVLKTVENVAKVLYLTACCKGGYITDWSSTMQYPVKAYWLHLADAVWRFVYDSPVQRLRDSAQRGEKTMKTRPCFCDYEGCAECHPENQKRPTAVSGQEKSSRQKVNEAIEKSRQPGTWIEHSQPGFDAGFREGVERAANHLETVKRYGNYTRRELVEKIRSLLPPAQPEPACGECGGTGVAAHLDGVDHPCPKCRSSHPEPSPAKMSREALLDELARVLDEALVKSVEDEGGSEFCRAADAALAFMEKNWGPK